ncbi:P-type ATPase3, putative, partial [Perkinsus marinus ATCC 50983]
MTMSVVIQNMESGEAYVFCKGSHEAVLSRCNFHRGEESAGSDTREVFEGLVVSAAEQYAAEGCYVLAIAARKLSGGSKDRSASRQELESGLSLLGLLLFRNELKPDSKRHIECLKAGGIDSVMITGDSVLTGATVGRKVGIIPRADRVVIGGASAEGTDIEWRDMDSHEIVPETAVCGPGTRPTSLCVTGACFAALLRSGKLAPLMGCRGECENSLLSPGARRPGLVDCSCARIRVFGRMTPHQKVSVITAYSRPPLNLITGMCGDGGNDSGALRAAAAGLALSGRVEASVAAPFSTDSPSIGSLVLLLREARGSLCTSFASYRFLVVRGILGALGKIVLLSMVGAYLAPLGYLFHDLIMTPLFLWAISMARPARTLAAVAPEGSLLGPGMVTASVLTVLLLTLVLLTALGILYLQDGESWFIRFNDESSDIHEWQKRSDNFEAALTWVWMSWATIDVAVCYSYGHVYRRAVYVALGLGCAHLPTSRYRNLALMVTVIALGVP